jgi:hypothetical protein
MNALAISRPRLIPSLSILAGALLAAYIALIIAAILFAALQTQLAQNVQSTRMEIGKLESTYYAGVAQLDSTDPQTLGYVTPTHVQYVSAAQLPNLTFAQN